MPESVSNPLDRSFTMPSLLRFAAPTIVMMLFMGLYTIGDTVMISRLLGANALSALNIVTPVINLIVGLGAMLATGGNAIIARKLGEGCLKRASQDFTLIVIAGAVLGLAFAATGTLLIDRIIMGLGASELLFPDCRRYLFVLLLFTPASILQVLFQNLFVTAGRPGFGMVLSVGAGVVNVLLDYVFMAPLSMGIGGAALATGIGSLIPAAAGIVYFSGAKGALSFRRPVADLRMLLKSCSNGFSEMVSQLAAAVATLLFNLAMMRLIGEAGVAAITIIIYTQFLLTALYIGFSMGVAPVISFHFGRKDYGRLKRIFRSCLLFIGGVSVLVFICAMVFASPLVSIFTPRGTELYQLARQGFLIFPFSFLFCGLNIFTSAAFTALSNGTASALISTLRTFVLLSPLLVLLPAFIGVAGVWLAVPLAEFATSFLSVLLLMKNRRRYHYF